MTKGAIMQYFFTIKNRSFGPFNKLEDTEKECFEKLADGKNKAIIFRGTGRLEDGRLISENLREVKTYTVSDHVEKYYR